MNFVFFLIGIAILVLGALGHIAAGVAKVDLEGGVRFTVPAWLGGGALFIALAFIIP